MVDSQLQWDSLPSHLQELILAHLPVSEHSRLRSVNRAWLSVLSSSHFRDLHRRLHPRLCPSFLVYNHAVKISALQWPPRETDDSPATAAATAPAAPPAWGDLSLPTPFVREWVAGARSLVCLRNHLTSRAFSVGCPYSNQWKTLPDPPRVPLLSKLWAMVPHSTSTNTSNRYSVILLQLNTPSLYIDVYNSEKNTWTQRMVPKDVNGRKGSLVTFSSSAVTAGGLLFSVQAESRSVVTYDVQRDAWKTLEAKLPENLVFQAPKSGGLIQATPHVMQGCKGKVLLVGAETPVSAAAASASSMSALALASSSDRIANCDDDGNDLNGAEAVNKDITKETQGINIQIVVWELDWFTKQWREITKAPSHMCMHMLGEAMESCKMALTTVRFSGYGELVVVMAAGSQRALQFDVIEEKWAWLDLPAAVNCDLSLCVDPVAVDSF